MTILNTVKTKKTNKSIIPYRHLGVGVGDPVEAGGGLGAVEADGEEDLLVLLHCRKDLGVQVTRPLKGINFIILSSHRS